MILTAIRFASLAVCSALEIEEKMARGHPSRSPAGDWPSPAPLLKCRNDRDEALERDVAVLLVGQALDFVG